MKIYFLDTTKKCFLSSLIKQIRINQRKNLSAEQKVFCRYGEIVADMKFERASNTSTETELE